jgi:hypothetical protein
MGMNVKDDQLSFFPLVGHLDIQIPDGLTHHPGTGL